MAGDLLSALLDAVQCLEQMGLVYAIGGSVASSVFGEPRASADADMIVELTEARLSELVARLGARFYVSEEAAREAIRRHSSFNVIHEGSAYKLDMFVAGPDQLDREQLRRREQVALTGHPESRAYVTAAENIVLRKLDGSRKGGGVSEQQWRDVLGVLKVQGLALDMVYLRDVACSEGLEGLLDRALGEAGLRPA
ncbi:MAG TPA: hypothetical protein VKB80_05630 [Kofleriaceae bacterium]|nr:hypothetical protein [Kofleriaceae bacterium]